MSFAENNFLQPGAAANMERSADVSLFEVVQEITDRLKDANCLSYSRLSCIREVKTSVLAYIQEVLSEKSHENIIHKFRMQHLSVEFGSVLDLSVDELDSLVLVAALHDIGSIVVPSDVINKPAKLTKDEWEKVKSHCEYGYMIAISIQEISHLALGILHHHEWWDGTGYPDGLKGNNIPFISRIIAIVDAFDAMTEERPFRKALSEAEAIEELIKFAGSQFDPRLTDLFVKAVIPYLKI